MTKVTRAPYRGQKNNKEKTMRKLLDGVGKVLTEKGYTGLTSTNISKAAGVDRKLINLYFDSVENLIEIYIRTKDYWLTSSGKSTDQLKDLATKNSKAVLEKLLLDQLDNFLINEEMQKAVTWQISEKSKIMSEITREREKISALFFEISDQEFKNKEVDLRAISGILVAGIYYLVLHAKHTDSTVCEIELDDNGFDRIRKAIKFILKMTYAKK